MGQENLNEGLMGYIDLGFGISLEGNSIKNNFANEETIFTASGRRVLL